MDSFDALDSQSATNFPGMDEEEDFDVVDHVDDNNDGEVSEGGRDVRAVFY